MLRELSAAEGASRTTVPQRMLTVRPSGDLDLFTLQSCCSGDTDQHLMIDLRSCTFVRPSGMVFLGVAMESAARLGEGDRQLRLAPGSDVAKYTDRMGLAAAAARCGVASDPFPGVRRYDPRDRFLELTKFDTAGNASAIDEVCQTLQGKAKAWMIEGQSLYNAVFELGVNVEYHSTSAGLVAVQHYPTSGSVEFAIGDYGIGIRQSLADGGLTYPDDVEAIQAAVETPASGTGISFRGKGLPDLHRILCSPRLRGYLVIQTGFGRVEYVNGRPPRTIHLKFWQPGTLAFGRFHTG